MTNREAHEKTAGMGLDNAFFRMNGIDPDAEVNVNTSSEVNSDDVFNSQTIWPADYYEC